MILDAHNLPVGGKKPARHDPRTLTLSSILRADKLPPLAPGLTNIDRVHPWGMYANDKLGDCTLAGAAHLIMLWAAMEQGHVTPSVKSITTLYKHLSPNDSGLVLLDVLNLWRHTGIAQHQIHSFVKLDRLNLETHLKYAITLFGAAYAGLMLPLSAQDQVGGVWDVPATGLHGKGAKGSWGGHCVDYAGYDEDGVDIVTWGTKQRATWRFIKTYGDEEYALLTQDWATAPKSAGIDFEALLQELTQISHAA